MGLGGWSLEWSVCGAERLVERLGGCVKDATSAEYVDSLLVGRWKADTYVVLTPPPALPTLSLAHTLTSGTARARLARTLFTWSGGAEGAISLPAAP